MLLLLSHILLPLPPLSSATRSVIVSFFFDLSSDDGMNLGIWTLTAQCTAAAAVDGKDGVFALMLDPSPSSVHTLAQCISEENLVNKLIGPLLEAICEKGGWFGSTKVQG